MAWAKAPSLSNTAKYRSTVRCEMLKPGSKFKRDRKMNHGKTTTKGKRPKGQQNQGGGQSGQLIVMGTMFQGSPALHEANQVGDHQQGQAAREPEDQRTLRWPLGAEDKR